LIKELIEEDLLLMKVGGDMKMNIKKMKFRKGDSVRIKNTLYYVEDYGGLVLKDSPEWKHFCDRRSSKRCAYLRKGTLMKAMNDGYFMDIDWEGGGRETGLLPEWIDLRTIKRKKTSRGGR